MAHVSKGIETKSDAFAAPRMSQLVAVFMVLVLELVIAYQVANGYSLYLLFSFLLISLLVLAFFSLESAVLFLFVYITFDGLIKNLTSYNPFVHVAKDVFLLAILTAYLIPRLLKKESLISGTPINFLILIFALICFLQFLNPATHPIVGLGGIKIHVLPIALFFIAFSVFETKEQIDRFVVVLVVLGTVVAIYSFVQYIQGAENVAKMGPGFSNVVYDRAALWRSTTTGSVNFRPFSTAQDCGAAAMYYLVTLPLALALLMAKRSSTTRRLFLVSSAGLLFSALILSGVRTAWLGALLGLLLFGILSKKARLFFVVLFLGALALYFALFLSSGGIMERIQLIANPWQAFVESRSVGITDHLVWAVNAYPFGRGLGRAGPGGAVFAQWFPQEASSFVGAHNYFLVMIYEIGVAGALVILWISLAVLRQGFNLLKQLQDKDLKWVAIGITSMLFAMLLTWLGGPTLMSNPAGYYFWFLSGMLLKLKYIDEPELDLTQVQGGASG